MFSETLINATYRLYSKTLGPHVSFSTIYRLTRIVVATSSLYGPLGWRKIVTAILSPLIGQMWSNPVRPSYTSSTLERALYRRTIREFGKARGKRRIQVLLLLGMYAYAFELEDKINVSDTLFLDHPELLFYVFAAPEFFVDEDQYKKAIDYFQILSSKLEGLAQSRIDDGARRKLAKAIATSYSFFPLLFSKRSLKPFAKTMAYWIERYLRDEGQHIDYAFPANASNKQPIVGVLVRDAFPRNEIFLTLPFGIGLRKAGFTTWLITLNPIGTDHFSEFVRQSFDAVKEITANEVFEQVAAIRRLNVDILILGNVMTCQAHDFNLLIAHRLARRHVMTVAVSPTTTGFSSTDYVLTSAVTEPANAAEHYTEEVVWIDGINTCFEFGPENPTRPQNQPEHDAVALPSARISFASGAVIRKITPEVRETWARILKAVPSSELFLYPFNPNWNADQHSDDLKVILSADFQKRGISSSRVHILPPMTPGQICAFLRNVSLYLDAFPFAGGASLLDPLLVGCPVITLAGETQRGLLGASILGSVGMGGMITQTTDEYVDLAVSLALDPRLRDTLSERIHHALPNAPFFDVNSYSFEVGKALRQILQWHPSELTAASDNQLAIYKVELEKDSNFLVQLAKAVVSQELLQSVAHSYDPNLCLSDLVDRGKYRLAEETPAELLDLVAESAKPWFNDERKDHLVVMGTTFWGERMLLVPPEHVSVQILQQGYFEEDLTEAIRKLLRPGDSFIDVGAHFGYFSLLAAHLVGSDGSVHSFEPTDDSRKILELNCRSHTRIKIRPEALWSHSTKLRFHQYGVELSAYNSVFQPRLNRNQAERLQQVTKQVSTTTLDSYVSELGIEPRMIKIDAESSESRIIAGAIRTLEDTAPFVSLELGDFDIASVPDSRELIKKMSGLNYTAFEFDLGHFIRHELRDRYSYTNLIFVPERRLGEMESLVE